MTNAEAVTELGGIINSRILLARKLQKTESEL